MKSFSKIFFLFFCCHYLPAQVSLPKGFNIQVISNDWERPVGIVFGADGTMYVVEKEGTIWLVKDGEKLPTPFLDIKDEVANFGDMGLLGFALHPNFSINGFCYLYYSADYNHVANEGKPDFDPKANAYERATIGRVVRYKAKSPNFQTVDISSKHILIGETLKTGIPLLHAVHMGGTIAFGTDGSLLISTGDASTWEGHYTGNGPPYFGEKVIDALENNIIQPAEEVGSYRSQLINSLNGKILRIHPATGDGLPSNPFFDTQNPRAPQSRVWSMGFRNAYRFIVRPNTGSTNPNDGLPGSLYIGDVGNAKWEELNIATKGGDNYGWPIFEGIGFIPEYGGQLTFNQGAINPLFSEGNCDQEYFYFQDLIQQPSKNPIIFSNPCDTSKNVPDSFKFIHHPPDLALAHITIGGGFYTPAFDENGDLFALKTDQAESPILDNGTKVSSNAPITMGFYQGQTFPTYYHNKFFIGDYVKGWIKAIEVDLNENIIGIEDFFHDTIFIADGKFNPTDGSLYFIDYKHFQIKKISYNENVPPIAIANADVYFGSSPLEVQFSGNDSYDPQQDSISFLWDFGDGMTSTNPNPKHIFQSENAQPKSYRIQLTVTDDLGASNTKDLLISVNNTPPVVKITSVKDGDTYSLNRATQLPLTATVQDNEHAEKDLKYAWQTILNHNSHSHPEPIDTNKNSHSTIIPTGCDGEIYSYDILLEVTDGAGLKGSDQVRIYPDCAFNFVSLIDFKVEKESKAVLCNWSTSSEINLDFMEVQRKIQGSDDYETLAKVLSKNIHQIKTDYEFLDANPLQGLNTYRLAMVSKDGLVDYSLTASVFFFPKGELAYYPNPTSGKVIFYWDIKSEQLDFKLYNSTGQLVQTQQWTDFSTEAIEVSVNIANLPAGVYYFSMENGEQIETGKIIKQ